MHKTLNCHNFNPMAASTVIFMVKIRVKRGEKKKKKKNSPKGQSHFYIEQSKIHFGMTVKVQSYYQVKMSSGLEMI